MRLTIEKGKKGNVLLQGELTIYTAGSFTQSLRENLKENDAIVLDFGGVTKVDSTAFQSLYYAQRWCTSEGKTLSYSNVTENLNNLFTLYGEEM
jgi:anti-anti-sigma factor